MLRLKMPVPLSSASYPEWGGQHPPSLCNKSCRMSSGALALVTKKPCLPLPGVRVQADPTTPVTIALPVL